jgi:Mycobacterium membrane protein
VPRSVELSHVRRPRIPPVLLAGVADLTLSGVHGAFDADKRPGPAAGKADDAQPFGPEQLTSPGGSHRCAVAYVGYSDVTAVRLFVDGARLPLSSDIGQCR